MLTAAAFALSFLFSYGPDAPRMSGPGALTIALATAGVVWLSGRKPARALGCVVVMACGLPVIDAVFPAMDLLIVLVLFRASVATALPGTWLTGIGLLALVLDEAWQRVVSGESFARPSVVYPLLLTALSVGSGLQSRRVVLQHQELVALREADRQRAVSDERRRIARDLHDVAAHHLSVLVVRNGLARRLGTPEALGQAAEFTARTAAETLDALRHVVRVLTTEGRASTAPAPSLADLEAVVERVRAAGLLVTCQAGDVGPVGDEVAVALVRIAQEALANVLKHRGPGLCWLQLVREHDVVLLSVEDDGPGTWPASPCTTAAHGRGHGLTIMRERAEACGGSLRVCPSDHGGWRVQAAVPVPAGPPAPPPAHCG